MTADAVGGVWTYLQELAAALEPFNVYVTIAVMGPAPIQAQRRAIQRLDNVELFHRDFRLEWMDEPWRDVDLAGEWLLQLAEACDADVVHLNGYAHAALPWRVPVLVVAHSCVLSWWRAMHGADAPATWNEYRRRVAAGLQAAHHVVAPTDAFLKELPGLYLDLPACSVIHNARSQCAFSAGTQHTRNERRPFVFSAGRLWDEAKNMATLDQAAKDLSWPVFVAGDCIGPDLRQAQLQHAHALGVLPPSEISDWLQRCGLYVSTAVYEPFGLSILEAALHGCALVLSDIATLRELWEGAAVFIPARDAQAMHAALTELTNDHTRLLLLADAAQQRAQRFNTHTMAAAYLDRYRQLIARRSIECSSEVSPRLAPIEPMEEMRTFGNEPRFDLSLPSRAAEDGKGASQLTRKLH